MTNKEQFTQKLEKELDDLSLKIDQLKVRANVQEVKAKQEFNDKLHALKQERIKARQKLDELKDSSENAWEDLKAGAFAANEALKMSVNQALNRF